MRAINIQPEPPDPDTPNTATHSFSTVLNINGSDQSSFLPLCPPHGKVGHYLTLLLTTSSIFLSAWTILGPIAAPGGTVFALLVLIVLALLGGRIIKIAGSLLSKLFRVNISLPPLLGMLVVGIILKNVPYNFGQFGRAECTPDGHSANGSFIDSINELDSLEEHGSFKRSIPEYILDSMRFQPITKENARNTRSVPDTDTDTDNAKVSDCHPKYIGHELDPLIARQLRTLCLTVILIRAGLEMDPVALWNLSGMVLRATFIPCFVEAAAVAALSHFIMGFPLTVGLMLGFVLAAVSPAVIIPCLISIAERGYGVAKGIPTLVISACAADDVVAISGFGIFLGITFNENADTLQLALHGPIEVLIGLSFGIFWGLLAQWIPDKNHPHVSFFRWLIVFAGGLIALYGAHLIHYDGAGGLAAILLSLIASMQWRKEGWGEHNPVSDIFNKMWIILEPVIFALIGTEIQIDKIDPSTIGYGTIVLVGALLIRMVGTYFAVSFGTLNTKEKIFMAFAWMPKATVQAALGPVFLDNCIKYGREEWQPMGEEILTLAVLSILITAPLGAVCILALGPLLLDNTPPPAPAARSHETVHSHAPEICHETVHSHAP